MSVLAVAMVMLLGLAVGVAAPAADTPAAKYICTHCKIGADKAGKCPLCDEPMKKAGAYACPACDTTSDKPGKCACGRDLVKVEMAGVKCDRCGYYHSKEAQSCPVCAKKAMPKQHD